MAKICTVDGCGQEHEARGLCKAHYFQDHYRRNQEKKKQAARAYREANLEDILAARRTEEYRSKVRAQNAARRDEMNAKKRERRAANREPDRAYASRRRQENPGASRREKEIRRARKKGVQEPDMGHLRALPCAQCGAYGPSTIDHIVPLSWCSTIPEAKECCEDPACYQPLCQSCNSAKGSRGVWAFVPTGTIGD